jgi:hypothetical protein
MNSNTGKEHKQHFQVVLERLRQERPFCKKSKCHFNKNKVRFLGHVGGEGSIAMQQEKVKFIVTWPVPRSKVELQAFLGLANYYRKFINPFSSMASPLTDALRGDKKNYKWVPHQQESFEKAKRAFITAPVPRIPNPTILPRGEIPAHPFCRPETEVPDEIAGQSQTSLCQSRNKSAKIHRRSRPAAGISSAAVSVAF